jgi:hypothetical protein
MYAFQTEARQAAGTPFDAIIEDSFRHGAGSVPFLFWKTVNQ